MPRRSATTATTNISRCSLLQPVTSPSRRRKRALQSAATFVWILSLTTTLPCSGVWAFLPSCSSIARSNNYHPATTTTTDSRCVSTPTFSSTALSVISLWASRTSLRRSSGSSGGNRKSQNMAETARLVQTSWSKAGGGNNAADASHSSSRFGVRKRVRAVLQQAKNRTGLNNYNADYQYNDNDSSKGRNDNDPTEKESMATSSFASFSSPNGLRALMDLAQGVSTGAYPSSSSSSNELDNFYSSFQSNDSASLGGDQVDALLQSASGSPLSSMQQKPVQRQPLVAVNAHNNNKDLVNGAVQQQPEPLPFTLPTLTDEQRRLLRQGERLQEQSKMGREGSGYVVLDVEAPPYIVWECLLDFEAYPENIGTVRSMRMFTNEHMHSSYIAEKPVLPGTGRETRHYGTASITRASFVLSKFRLNIAAIHQYQPHPDGHYMVFTLDKACTNVVLQDAKGIWYTESNPDGREGITRVWLMCELKVSSILPTFIVDYAAKRAMPRATTWLKPTVEVAKKRLLGGVRVPPSSATMMVKTSAQSSYENK